MKFWRLIVSWQRVRVCNVDIVCCIEALFSIRAVLAVDVYRLSQNQKYIIMGQANSAGNSLMIQLTLRDVDKPTR